MDFRLPFLGMPLAGRLGLFRILLVLRRVRAGAVFADAQSGVLAGITAFASIAFLMHYFKKHEFEALDPFAYYCWAAGSVFLALLLLN